jgi:hypothetical protein
MLDLFQHIFRPAVYVQAMASDTTPFRLLALPDSCLLAVMQCCADDPRSLLSAATAHSKLQRAAVEALSSISAEQLHCALPWPWPSRPARWTRDDSLLLYLAKHGQHVRSLVLTARSHDYVQLLELPPSLTKLDSLRLEGMGLVRLQPGDGDQGVLRAGFPLTRLELSRSSLLDGPQALAAALAQLPDLQRLSICSLEPPEATIGPSGTFAFRTDALTHLQKLTCLTLAGIGCCNRASSSSSSSSSGSGDGNAAAALQPLQALTRLADLELRGLEEVALDGADLLSFCCLHGDALSGASQLTRLVVSSQELEPRVLAGKSQLQHLTLRACSVVVPGGGVAQLLSELQHLTQLTHLDLDSSCRWRGAGGPPPAAYASLTASSRLQHLDFSYNTLPATAWQYMCPPGRTLPQLRCLDVSDGTEADRSPAPPDTSALVSCCPGLQSLATSMPCSTAQLTPLQRLTDLRTLAVGAVGDADELEGVQVLCQLTGLQELDLRTDTAAESCLLQLTRLTRLTALVSTHRGGYKELRCNPQVSWG